MIRLRLDFASGRYHGTPWGRHVNEGVAEWPPSPYRLLRALYDVWQRKCPDIEEPEVRAVLGALGSQTPDYHLPKATATHTRSYLSANSQDPTDKNLVFDAFLAFGDGRGERSCWATWNDVDLDMERREVLNRLVTNLNYLGRSESWIDIHLTEEEPWSNALPCTAKASGNGATTRVACTLTPDEFGGDWMSALTYSTADLLKQKSSAPPLLKTIDYSLPNGAIEADPPRRSLRRSPEIVEIVLGLGGTVLPLATETLSVAEQIRTRLMGASRKINGAENVSSLFSGKEAGEKRLDHGHLYILPQANKLGRIDRVILRSTLRPFDRNELDSVRRVTGLWQSDNRPAVRCVVAEEWKVADLRNNKANIVASTTPFVPPRFLRKKQDLNAFLLDSVRRECENHGVRAHVREVRQKDQVYGLFHGVEFYSARKNDCARRSYALELLFDQPVRVPFSIGYAAHFGLGQFNA